MDHSTRQEQVMLLQNGVYVALPFINRATRWDALKMLNVANQTSPNQPCGHARRIGSVRGLVVYRLKIRYSPQAKDTLTLPSLFVLDEGVFQTISHDNG